MSTRISNIFRTGYISLFLFLSAHTYVFAIDINSLYVNEYRRYFDCDLYKINSKDGSASLIGSTGISGITDIAFLDSDLYGITFSKLLKIDPNTGKGTVIGDLVYEDMNSLAVSPDGYMYSGSLNGEFTKINPVSQEQQLIGNYGNGITSSGDLAFLPNGELYATVKVSGYANDWLANINPDTGVATLIGDIGYDDIWGLSYKNGELYGSSESGNLFKVDITTGLGTIIGSSAFDDLAGMSTSPLLSPIVGEFGIVTDSNCSSLYEQDSWCFDQHQGSSHGPGTGAGNSDDTFAWDINLNAPVWNTDKGKPVYAVAPGIVPEDYGSHTNAGGSTGQVLIEHNDGEWWSGYVHLERIRVEPGEEVTENTIVGYISGTGGYPDHLHFVLYAGENIEYGLKSFNSSTMLVRQADEFCFPVLGVRGRPAVICL